MKPRTTNSLVAVLVTTTRCYISTVKHNRMHREQFQDQPCHLSHTAGGNVLSTSLHNRRSVQILARFGDSRNMIHPHVEVTAYINSQIKISCCRL